LLSATKLVQIGQNFLRWHRKTTTYLRSTFSTFTIQLLPSCYYCGCSL